MAETLTCKSFPVVVALIQGWLRTAEHNIQLKQNATPSFWKRIQIKSKTFIHSKQKKLKPT